MKRALEEDFLLIYIAIAPNILYEELLIFLGWSYSDLLNVLESFKVFGYINFEMGRYFITEEGMKKISVYDLNAFDFSNGINVNNENLFVFKQVDYVPLDFYKKFNFS